MSNARSYVYAITADGVVRYIGKGTGDRLPRHFRRVECYIARRAAGEKVRTGNLHHQMIRALAAGIELAGEVIASGLTDAEACERERAEIAARTGLWNLREGGEGWTTAEVRALWADSAMRARMLAARQKAWGSAENKANHAAAMRRAYADPIKGEALRKGLAAGRVEHARKKQGASLARSLDNEEGRERMRRASLIRWGKLKV